MSCSNQETDIEEEYIPVPFSLKVPELFQQKLIDPLIPNNNPLTEEGVALGKKLFKEVKVFKPKSSRKESKESFIICKILR